MLNISSHLESHLIRGKARTRKLAKGSDKILQAPSVEGSKFKKKDRKGLGCPYWVETKSSTRFFQLPRRLLSYPYLSNLYKGPGIEKDGRDPNRNMADGFRDYTLTWRKWNMDAPIAEPSRLEVKNIYKETIKDMFTKT
ncbi:hypothetical protein V1478_013302 [Vespula squamosa]|uniref:Uncharacterized protein n=1 Tax=Vespula squamosa TaxID=30214 RepID=A0ABD2AAF4_VESSQ